MFLYKPSSYWGTPMAMEPPRSCCWLCHPSKASQLGVASPPLVRRHSLLGKPRPGWKKHMFSTVINLFILVHHLERNLQINRWKVKQNRPNQCTKTFSTCSKQSRQCQIRDHAIEEVAFIRTCSRCAMWPGGCNEWYDKNMVFPAQNSILCHAKLIPSKCRVPILPCHSHRGFLK